MRVYFLRRRVCYRADGAGGGAQEAQFRWHNNARVRAAVGVPWQLCVRAQSLLWQQGVQP
eukprot:9485386-Pyramimonas_sp.AAC.1